MLHFGPFFSQAAEWIHNQTDFALFVQAAAIILFTLLFLVSIFAEKIKNSGSLFLLLGLLTISLFRSFTFYADSYNPDEGMHLANAIALNDDFRPWGSTDFTTFGPVNAVLILLTGKILAFFGIKSAFSYFTLRLLNLLILDVSFILFQKTLEKNVQPLVSRSVSMLFVIFYGFHFQADCLAFNSEITYLLFITAALYLLCRMDGGISKRMLFGFGAVCGTMPYIKLQTVPMCAVMLCGGYARMLCFYRPFDKTAKKNALRSASMLTAGVLLPTMLVAMAVFPHENGFQDAWFCFIENAKSHIGNPGAVKYVSQLIRLLEMFSPDALKIGIVVSVALAAYLAYRKHKVSWGFLFSVLLLLASSFAAVRSFRLFYHYIHFLVVPVLLFLAIAAQMLADQEECFVGIRIKPVLIGLLFFCSIRQFGIYYEEIKTNTVFSSKQVVGESHPNLTQAAAFLSEHTSSGDTVVIWGWESRLYVYANRRSATRQTDIQRLFAPYSERNVQMYLADIQSNHPAYLVDVVAPGSFAYEEEDKYGLEQYAPVWDAVKDEYVLVHTMPVEGGSYKFYKRIKD